MRVQCILWIPFYSNDMTVRIHTHGEFDSPSTPTTSTQQGNPSASASTKRANPSVSVAKPCPALPWPQSLLHGAKTTLPSESCSSRRKEKGRDRDTVPGEWKIGRSVEVGSGRLDGDVHPGEWRRTVDHGGGSSCSDISMEA